MSAEAISSFAEAMVITRHGLPAAGWMIAGITIMATVILAYLGATGIPYVGFIIGLIPGNIVMAATLFSIGLVIFLYGMMPMLTITVLGVIFAILFFSKIGSYGAKFRESST